MTLAPFLLESRRHQQGIPSRGRCGWCRGSLLPPWWMRFLYSCNCSELLTQCKEGQPSITHFLLGWVPVTAESGTRLDFMPTKVFASSWQKGDKPGQPDLIQISFTSVKLAVSILMMLFPVCTEVRTLSAGFVSWTGMTIIFLQVLVFVKHYQVARGVS